jgi:hypothetical protein
MLGSGLKRSPAWEGVALVSPESFSEALHERIAKRWPSIFHVRTEQADAASKQRGMLVRQIAQVKETVAN